VNILGEPPNSATLRLRQRLRIKVDMECGTGAVVSDRGQTPDAVD
jgi:hypothetical protein